jgi:hypothetical protein
MINDEYGGKGAGEIAGMEGGLSKRGHCLIMREIIWQPQQKTVGIACNFNLMRYFCP